MNTLEHLRSGALAGARRLTLREGLSEFPREIFELAETLEVLDLSGNELASLPDDLPRLQRLRIIFCSNNRFTTLPAVLGRCAQLEMVGFKANRIRQVPAEALPERLRWLILTDNEIEALPAAIGRCGRLQKLALAGNRLRGLPADMAACTRLELLRISANRLAALPDWLLTLPRLSWLAYAGNPFCEVLEQATLAQAPLATIAWRELRLHEQLGEGASGVIHRAERVGCGTPLAVKIFKGEVTSDGLPRSEMAAAMLAGEHPNLIPLLGRISGHPVQAQGLVMQLIPPEFRSLAQPPSLDSCTRDIYPDGSRFELDSALALARGIASAARQLHQRGVSHGDLYGHNILHDGRGQALLGDFGAASLFDPDDMPMALALQGLEVRAFGCLLEELLAHIEPASRSRLDKLEALRQACLSEVATDRPLFADIEQALR
ncbi:leucine-rich repeat-containing protein kinase family protein [Paucibacter sp. XJ19-41]|uniref:leucine-rich repeat-containing protein kinase family protein n=1 Tax=Paucibacter sp. XJ19-41 TaxID=2927824 RepID=UPI002348F89E|nr:leucine-rich repeat-containing protein kinase family protein [Paucibacter sp. XJ19-41]MDC6167346.1 leucine-rich repeat-containing protein kinase family protein [Paucibacter sp. XJ19-41]